jgi:hypothetical protein
MHEVYVLRMTMTMQAGVKTPLLLMRNRGEKEGNKRMKPEKFSIFFMQLSSHPPLPSILLFY